MKATIERATLLKSLSHVQSVVERRNTIPILSNVLLDAREDGSIRVMATDLDLQVDESVPANVTQPGATTVSAHTLFDIVRKLPEGSQVDLSAAEGKMQVNAGRARFNLATLPRDDFPVIAEGDLPTRFELPAATTASMIRCCEPHRHRLRSNASATRTPSAPGSASSSAAARTTIPATQNPHCAACRSRIACWTGCGPRSSESPSTVVTAWPSACHNGVWQEGTTASPRRTKQAPQSPSPQPNRLPTSRSSSRSAVSSGVSPSLPSVTSVPLTVSRVTAPPRTRQGGGRARCGCAGCGPAGSARRRPGRGVRPRRGSAGARR